MRRVVLGLAVILLPTAAMADDSVGRYQAIAVPQPTNAVGSGQILLLDTRDGQVWEWWSSPTMGNVPGGAGITYMGKLTPGTKPGDIVQRFRY